MRRRTQSKNSHAEGDEWTIAWQMTAPSVGHAMLERVRHGGEDQSFQNVV